MITMAGVNDVILMVVSFLTSLAVVLIFIVIGWYIVWVAFLSRFKLMRELLSINDDDAAKDKETKNPPSNSDASLSASTKRTRQYTSQRT